MIYLNDRHTYFDTIFSMRELKAMNIDESVNEKINIDDRFIVAARILEFGMRQERPWG